MAAKSWPVGFCIFWRSFEVAQKAVRVD